MCGIVGVMLRKPGDVGERLRRMMLTLQHRGTDSAGVAIYTPELLGKNEYILMVQVADVPGAIGEVGNAIGSAGGDIRNIEFRASPSGGVGLNRYVVRVPNRPTLEKVVGNINGTRVGEVFSYGRSIQVIKDVGIVDNLEIGYDISKMVGTHGIGHVRFSTESRVDRRHAHPFHTDVYPDIAVVHNGQITNYYKIRRILERKGHTFTSENDTECIVHFIVDRLHRGYSLKGALKSSINELDGPFSYIISTPAAIGVARDKLGLRPVMLAQDRSGYYIASEECALVGICKDSKPEYLEPGEVRVFERESH
jgi:glutamine phosphoribosylpyrophosphate amidotransferase